MKELIGKDRTDPAVIAEAEQVLLRQGDGGLRAGRAWVCRVRDVEQARSKILNIVRRPNKQGDIYILPAAADTDEYIR